MLELILENKKKDLQKEYKLRFLNVSLIMISLVLVMWIILMVPLLINVKVEKEPLEEKMRLLENSALAKDRASLETLSKELSNTINVFNSDKVSFSEVINNLTEKQAQDISVKLLAIEKSEAGELTLNIQGVANSRNGLRSFSDAISADPLFSKIDIPFSSFTKDTDIPFSFSIPISKSKDETAPVELAPTEIQAGTPAETPVPNETEI